MTGALEKAPETDPIAMRLHALCELHFHYGNHNKVTNYAESEALCVFIEPTLTRVRSLNLLGRFNEAAELVNLGLDSGTSQDIKQALMKIGFEVIFQIGDFQKGFEMLYGLCSQSVNPYPHLPRLTGQDLTGKTVIVWFGVGGIGDHIMFARFLQVLAGMGATAVVQARDSLVGLFASIAGVAASHPIDVPLIGDYAVQIYEIPHLLQASGETIPMKPYISAPPMILANGINIGLAWGAGQMNSVVNRTCALAELAVIADIQGVNLYSLQKGPFAQQLTRQPEGMRVIDISHELNDFTDTASAIAAMDAVVTTDNVVANLAGAMGKPVFVLAPRPADFRWGLYGGVSWYPSARVYEQRVKGEWAEPIAALKCDLEAYLRGMDRWPGLIQKGGE